MNFLELAQTTVERCGIQGSTTSPSTVVSQVGEMGRVVNWVNDAWVDVQRKHTSWNFRRGDFSFNTVAGTYVYALASCGLEANTELTKWLPRTFRRYLTSGGVATEQPMVEWPYEAFRDLYEFQSGQSGPPCVFAAREKDRALLLGPNPDAIYTVRGQYVKAALKMTVADASEPSIPTEFQMLIVYKAMMKYASYEAAPEVMAEASAAYSSLMADAEMALLPPIEMAEPLA